MHYMVVASHGGGATAGGDGGDDGIEVKVVFEEEMVLMLEDSSPEEACTCVEMKTPKNDPQPKADVINDWLIGRYPDGDHVRIDVNDPGSR
ncbi:hypothetical protein Tco_1264619 [Tanacetum coccineum]